MHLGLDAVEEVDDPLAGQDGGVDVLEAAPVLAHRMLEAEAAQHLSGHLQQERLDQRRLEDLGERGVVASRSGRPG